MAGRADRRSIERRRSERRAGEGARDLSKSAAWAVAVASMLIVCSVLLTGYLQFLQKTFGMDW